MTRRKQTSYWIVDVWSVTLRQSSYGYRFAIKSVSFKTSRKRERKMLLETEMFITRGRRLKEGGNRRFTALPSRSARANDFPVSQATFIIAGVKGARKRKEKEHPPFPLPFLFLVPVSQVTFYYDKVITFLTTECSPIYLVGSCHSRLSGVFGVSLAITSCKSLFRTIIVGMWIRIFSNII